MNAQQLFFENIKNHFSKATYSLVDDICDILKVEKSTAYKRINGETPLKFDEIRLLCTHFNLSIDNIFFYDSPTNISSFRQELFFKKEYDFTAFLKSFAAAFDTLRKGTDNTLYILCNELPVFYVYGFPNLIQFVYYSCRHETDGYPLYQSHMQLPPLDNEAITILKYLCNEYSNHPSTELLSTTILDALMQRIDVAMRTGMIDHSLKTKLYQDLKALVNHLELQCTSGYKISPYNGIERIQGTFLLNKVHSSGNNEIYYSTDDYEVGFVCNGICDYLITSDKNYCTYLKTKFTRVKNASVNITIENSLDRKQFFNELRDRLQHGLI